MVLQPISKWIADPERRPNPELKCLRDRHGIGTSKQFLSGIVERWQVRTPGRNEKLNVESAWDTNRNGKPAFGSLIFSNAGSKEAERLVFIETLCGQGIRRILLEIGSPRLKLVNFSHLFLYLLMQYLAILIKRPNALRNQFFM